ncbi:MAG: hypothetical protein O7C59_07980 [Rickettsia endosymbiont of Ixodes persulcatus]|nr:hypothetical protein [Rickettsia endosymbiont of Ixodes persulcatus]
MTFWNLKLYDYTPVARFYDCDNDGVVSKNEMMYSTKALFDMVGPTFDMVLDVNKVIDQLFFELENQSGFLTLDDFRSIAKTRKDAFIMLTLFTED